MVFVLIVFNYQIYLIKILKTKLIYNNKFNIYKIINYIQKKIKNNYINNNYNNNYKILIFKLFN